MTNKSSAGPSESSSVQPPQKDARSTADRPSTSSKKATPKSDAMRNARVSKLQRQVERHRKVNEVLRDPSASPQAKAGALRTLDTLTREHRGG